MTFTIQRLTQQSRCGEVFGLYRKHSGTLGFLPRGAFEEGIAKGQLLVATDETEALIGYVLFRVVHRRTASITHLCVADVARQHGVATKLLDELKRVTAHLDGIKLKCRRDFEAHRHWPRWGFVARGHATGRGADNAELVIWHLDHNQADLLSTIPGIKTVVAIDANVFFDLFWPDRPKREISGALIEPWIDDVVELALTPEIYNDIDRCLDFALRQSSKAKAETYRQLRAAALEVDRVAAEIKRLYPASSPLNARDRSDIRHVANTVIAGVRFFVTRDEDLLAKAPEVLENYDVHLLSPVEFVSRLDSIEREQEYQPLRLGGSSITTKRLEASNLDAFIDAFRLHPAEKVASFRALVESCLANPKGCTIQVAHDSAGKMVAAIATAAQSSSRLRIPLLRLGAHELSTTILRHLLMNVVVEAVRAGAGSIHVEDPSIARDVVSALDEMGFAKSGNGWAKLVMKGFHSATTALDRLAELGISAAAPASDIGMDALATLIWPGKLESEDIGCYLIPIQAQWAEHFFDVDLASQRLPGISDLREELHLGVEAVYYSASNVGMKAPGHILWYVSEGVEGLGSMQVKATSRLREVVRGTPKQLFSRFRRLGVYAWKDVMGAAKGNPDASLTALRFSHTELFPRPLNSDALGTHGVPPPYPGPRPIPFSTFREIYHHAFNFTL